MSTANAPQPSATRFIALVLAVAVVIVAAGVIGVLLLVM
jgi:preprotein translocase subunit Sss1